jgi:hypothetical protein
MQYFSKFVRKTIYLVSSIVFLSLLVAASGRAAERSSAQPPANQPSKTSVAVPAGQVDRYKIPNYTSQTMFGANRSFVEVTIENNSGHSCDAAVGFQFAFGTTDICSINLTIPSKQSRIYCSRPVPDLLGLASCTVSCPGSGLTFNTGHAHVSSSTSVGCDDISVDAQQFFTTGVDTLVASQSKLTVTKLDKNIGD